MTVTLPLAVEQNEGEALDGLDLLGAIGLLYPPTRVAAAACLFVLMLVMFPANVYAARMPNPPKSMTSRLSLRTAEEVVYLAAAVVVAVCSR